MIIVQTDLCETCGVAMQILGTESMRVCPICKRVRTYIETCALPRASEYNISPNQDRFHLFYYIQHIIQVNLEYYFTIYVYQDHYLVILIQINV